MALPFFGNAAKDYFLVFDIGNGSVGGALVKRSVKNDDFSLEIVKSKRFEITLTEHVGFEVLLKNMSQALESVIRALLRDMPSKRIPAYVVLASPWYVSQTTIVTVKKDRPFVLSGEMEEEILKKELDSFKEKISSKNKFPGGELQVMERNVIHARLNGYDTIRYLNKKTLEAKLAVYFSVVQKKVAEKIIEKLNYFLPRTEIAFHSFPLAYYSALRDMFPEKKDFLMMDVSGEITDVSLVRKGILLETFSFPLGRNFLLRRISAKTKSTLSEAESLNSLLSENAASPEEKKKLGEVLRSAKTEWLREFRKALNDLSGELYVPGEVFLAIDNDVAKLFASWISEDEFGQYSLSHKKFRVIPLSYARSMFFEKSMLTDHDQFIDIEALFAEKLIEVAS